jgi:hypothetical protein
LKIGDSEAIEKVKKTNFVIRISENYPEGILVAKPRVMTMSDNKSAATLGNHK